MSENREERIRAIRRLTDVAGVIADDREIVKPLVDSTGLSREGVQLALAHYLEKNPGEDEIGAMVDLAPTANRVHVLLSANVFTAPLRAIAWARAVAPKVGVSISSREPVFPTALLRELADPAISTVDRDALDHLRAGDEVHVYGRAETIGAIRARVPADVVVRAHGPGLGVAFVRARDVDISKLADDVIAFDQRGCLSPRIVFFEADGYSLGKDAFVAAFAETMQRCAVPRGDLSRAESAESVRYTETMRFVGAVDQGKDFVVGLANEVILPPTGRHVHFVPVRDWRHAAELAAPIAPLVTIVGSSDPDVASLIVPASVRVSQIGNMQKPPFDGPVDLRVL